MQQNTNRRKFLLSGAQAIALVGLGGLVWGAFLQESKANPLILRPPGALSQKEFLKTCIKSFYIFFYL